MRRMYEVIEEVLPLKGWQWEHLYEAWDRETGGIGVIDTLRKTKEWPDGTRWYEFMAKCLEIPVSFLHILLDDDPFVVRLRTIVLDYIREKSDRW